MKPVMADICVELLVTNWDVGFLQTPFNQLLSDLSTVTNVLVHWDVNTKGVGIANRQALHIFGKGNE